MSQYKDDVRMYEDAMSKFDLGISRYVVGMWCKNSKCWY